MTPQIRVRNLAEVKKALRSQDAALPKRLREELMPIARLVVSGVAAKVEHDTGAAAGSVTARAGQASASVSFGGASAPYFPWLDFGGSVGKGHRQGVPWSGSVRRPFIKGGRYVFPTIEAHRADIEEAALDAVTRVASDAGLRVV